MRFLLLFTLSAASAFANYSSQISVLLGAGVKTVTIANSGVGGGPVTFNAAPSAGQRVRFTISPIYVPPPSGTTYSLCADPCSVSINRNWGQQYFWVEYTDNSGNPFHPPKLSFQAVPSYNANFCGGAGTLPMVELAVNTTAPLPMPREVIGQDCYVTRAQLPLLSGDASAGLRLWARIHAAMYNSTVKWDNKLSVQVNSGSWIDL